MRVGTTSEQKIGGKDSLNVPTKITCLLRERAHSRTSSEVPTASMDAPVASGTTLDRLRTGCENNKITASGKTKAEWTRNIFPLLTIED